MAPKAKLPRSTTLRDTLFMIVVLSVFVRHWMSDECPVVKPDAWGDLFTDGMSARKTPSRSASGRVHE